MLRMVVFDFDGVIADSEPAHFEMFRKILQHEQIDVSWQDYCGKYLGYDDLECFAHILSDHGAATPTERITELAQRKSKEFARYLKDHCVIMPGVQAFLTDLRKHDIICSICSGALSSEIEFILKQAQLHNFFEVIVTAEDVAAGKPDPQGYRLALTWTNSRLDHQKQIRPDECAVIEDSLWGVQAAQGAGMFCLAVATSYPAEMLTAADAVVKDLTCLDAARLGRMLEG